MLNDFERLGTGRPRPAAAPVPELPATVGLIAEHRESGFSGEIAAVEHGTVVLRDWRGRERLFPMTPRAFLVDDRPATLVPPVVKAPAGPRLTASGSLAGPATRAQVARPHRIYVEGIHDAELIERVWGEELREAAVVVEPMHGADGLAAMVRAFAPGPGRRLGVLLDHLVPGSKEQRLADAVRSPYLLVTGHPYVDVWQGVRPQAAGLDAWPVVPRGQDWKSGVCAALGAGDPRAFWPRLLRSVRRYADLEPGLIGAVERLLDFLIEPE